MQVDHLLSGTNSIRNVASKYKTAQDIMTEANMSLEKLVSNCLLISSKFNDKIYFKGDGVNETNSISSFKWCNIGDTFPYDCLDLDPNIELVCTKTVFLNLREISP